jgi:ABC-type phosphate/phosphonate transport system substrate-binding protein
VCARNTLDPDIVSALKALLLDMHLGEDGRAVLLSFEETAKFDEFLGGHERDLEDIMRLLPHVEEDLGQ